MGLRRLVRWLRGVREAGATGFVYFRDADAVRRGRVVGPAGLGLIVSATVDGVCLNRIVTVGDADDPAAYWREWRAAGGGPLYDDAGREWDPETSRR